MDLHLRESCQLFVQRCPAVFNRVLQRSHCDPDHLDLYLLLRFIKDDTDRSREERFPKSSAVAEALERVATMD